MAKKKIKKFLKKLAPMAALALGAAALGRRGGTTAANVDSGRGGDSSSAAARVAANKIYQDGIMRGDFGVKSDRRNSIIADQGINRITDYYGASLKKGGRVGCGIAKKGFGRAMKKGRK